MLTNPETALSAFSSLTIFGVDSDEDNPKNNIWAGVTDTARLVIVCSIPEEASTSPIKFQPSVVPSKLS